MDLKVTQKRKISKPLSIKITVMISGQSYVLGVLSFNTAKEEFSYHFTYPSDSPKDHFNYDTGKYTARLDHITWHQNHIHIKRKDDYLLKGFNSNKALFFAADQLSHPCMLSHCIFQILSHVCSVLNILKDGKQVKYKKFSD